ncbi:MAG TPA: zinc-ribbon domain-containing protein [Verrucomicrobiae bacterium]|nr:zinc-ribbon domain-containing protein [Verrucomicrobiae bacterium]
MIVCPKCGYDNELGRIFCHSCGTKLDLTEIKAPSQGGKPLTKKAKSGSKKLVSRIFSVVLTAFVVVLVFLALQVPAVRPISTSSDDLNMSDRKRAALDNVLALKRPSTVSVTEGELNSFVQTLGFQGGKPGPFDVVPIKLQLEFGNGAVTVVLLGRLHIAGSLEKEIYLSYTGVPAIKAGHFVFQPTAGALGALPMSPWLLEQTGLYDRYFARLFAKQDTEKQILDSLSSITVTPQSLNFNYQPH